MADDVVVNVPEVVVTPQLPFKLEDMTEEQLAIAEQVAAEAEKQGLDPNLALSIAHIENRLRGGGVSKKGAVGPMQLMPGTAKELGVDPNDTAQNIAGGVRYYKQMLDKYKDPYVAGIAYNAGPAVADKFMQTKDPSIIPDETLDYVEALSGMYKPSEGPDVGALPEAYTPPKEGEAPKEPPLESYGGAAAGAAAGYGAGKVSEAAAATAAKEEAAAARQKATLERRIETAGTRKDILQEQHGTRLAEQGRYLRTAEEMAKQQDKQLRAAQNRLKRATDLARRYGVLEEAVPTTPGGVTQQGGLGSGAMRHSNVMGEVHEANIVRKGTEVAGPGWQQKSRLIVPEKYTSASVLGPEQIAAKQRYDKAMAEVKRLEAAAATAQKNLAKEQGKLRTVTQRGPAGVPQAETTAKIAAEQLKKVKPAASFGELAARYATKVPGRFVLPAAAAGFDIAEAKRRYEEGDIPGAAIAGLGGGLGIASSIPPLSLTPIGLGMAGASMALPFLNMYRDTQKEEPQKYAGGGLARAIGKALTKSGEKVRPTVREAERVAYPEVYRAPETIVAESATKVSPEDPILKQLWGVTREDLDAMTRAAGPEEQAAMIYEATRPPEYLQGVMGRSNTGRLQEILQRAEEDPSFIGSYGWYMMDPMKRRLLELMPEEEALKSFERFNQIGAGLSPSTDVPTEIKRASVAYLMDKQGRLADFLDPRNMPAGYGHAYHRTAHNAAIKNILESGDFRPEDLKKAPKTRVYYGSRMGENLDVPTADAHFIRGTGMADVRPATKAEDWGSSVSATELSPLATYYRKRVAEPIGMRASPAQALQWNAMGTSTGVESDLGVPLLELLSRRIRDISAKEGITPQTARDMFLKGELHLACGGRVKKNGRR